MPDNTQIEWVTPIINLVTSGGFGALAWYLIVKHYPAMEARHREERKEWKESLEKIIAKHEELTEKALEAIHSARNQNQ